ncbi:protein SanA [Candidatus Entotheonella serta]|nr:protein SanA [Candidatus Entotheonella serta]
MMRRPNKWQWMVIVVTLCLAGLPLLLIYISHKRIESYSTYLYPNLEAVPPFDVALLLGTTKSVFGRPNRFYQYRLQAAADLFFAGKIKAILISGDNAQKSYNEPIDMKNDLLKLGVPEGVLTLDYAGFSTLDSVLRAKRVFGQNRLLVVSQPFHCKRAIYIARRHRIEAYGFPAKDVTGPTAQKTYSREYLARVKALLDVELLNSQPRFLGKQEIVNGL